jgi:hypothetical protein
LRSLGAAFVKAVRMHRSSPNHPRRSRAPSTPVNPSLCARNHCRFGASANMASALAARLPRRATDGGEIVREWREGASGALSGGSSHGPAMIAPQVSMEFSSYVCDIELIENICPSCCPLAPPCSKKSARGLSRGMVMPRALQAVSS